MTSLKGNRPDRVTLALAHANSVMCAANVGVYADSGHALNLGAAVFAGFCAFSGFLEAWSGR